MQDASVVSTVGKAAGTLAAGPVGAAVGAIVGAAVGAVVGALTGQGATTGAHLPWAAQLESTLSSITTGSGIGRQIPWNENSHGLAQFIESILATGVYMGWDPSLISNYDVCAHWAVTFMTAVQQVTTAIYQNPVGATISLPITDKPGGNDARAGNFSFINPGYQVGCDAISHNIIMGNGGLMYWMIWRTGETQAHSQENASNAAAFIVFSMCVDHQISDLSPNIIPVTSAGVPTPVPNIAPAVVAASAAANTAVQAPTTLAVNVPAPVVAQPVATVQPVTAAQQAAANAAAYPVTPAAVAAVQAQPAVIAATPATAPVATLDPATAALIQQMLAQGASQQQTITTALQALEAQGVNSSAPAVQAAVTQAVAPSGISTNTMLLIGGGFLAIVLLMRK
jgi:hypothetical protein